MNQLYTRRKTAAPPRTELTAALRRQTAWAAGTEAFDHRDPLCHVTEDFHQTFDAMGRRHARQLAGQSPERTEGGGRTETGERTPDASSRSFYERDGQQEMLLRFSETAFQRGTLSGAVLEGTGQMMLFSCLKKTVGQSQPDKWQQRKLFEKASPCRNVPGHTPDRVTFNRGFTDSAVALTVDVLRDARRTVEDLRDLALGKSDMGAAGADTLRTMYPFLDDGRERALLAEYRAALKDPAAGPEARAAYQNAAGRLEALIAKKAQMKQEFINRLRFLCDRAGEALETFSAPGFPQRLDRALREALNADGTDGEDADGAADDGADPDADGAEAPPHGPGEPDA